MSDVNNSVNKSVEEAKEVMDKEVKSLLGKEDDWFSAQNVAAIAAAGTAVITMIGKRNCDVGAVVGAAAGVGVSYLGTKWITEAIGSSHNGLGKALGLFIGIDCGYGLTNLGINVEASRNDSLEAYL